jgi:hypothetical protein
MSLQVVFPRKCFVAANFGTSEWSFSVVASYVRLEAAWPVEALVADVTDVVPLATCLTFRPHLAVVGVVDLVVARVVRLLTQVSIFFRSWDGLAVAVMSLDSPIPIRGLFCGTPSASIVIFRFRAILTCATCGVTGSASRGAEASRTILSPRVRSKVPDANDPCRPRSQPPANCFLSQRKAHVGNPLSSIRHPKVNDHVRLRRRRRRLRRWK